MSGSSSSDLRSAFIAESTPGTIPSTPGFTNSVDPFHITATPEINQKSSLAANGRIIGQNIGAIPVSGSVSGSLIYGNMDDFFASLLQGAWSSNVLKDGRTRSTFAVENAIPAGAGGTNTMLRYRGVEPVGGQLILSSEEDIQYSMDLLGMGSDDGTTSAIAGATYTDASEVLPLSSGVDVGTITMAGYTLDCMQRAEINFSFVDRNRQPKIASQDLCGVTLGAFRPTIEARFLIEANFMAMYNAARSAHSTFAVTFPLGSVSTEKYTLEFPQCAFGPVAPDFTSAEAIQSVQILPQYDSTTENAVVKITRAVV